MIEIQLWSSLINKINIQRVSDASHLDESVNRFDLLYKINLNEFSVVHEFLRNVRILRRIFYLFSFQTSRERFKIFDKKHSERLRKTRA